MGGIGKTTLAQCLFDNLKTSFHFDYCMWVTISTGYNLRKILLGLVENLTRKHVDESLSIHQLGDILFQTLFGVRYFIIFDNCFEYTWHHIREFLPDNNRASRIVMTTWDSFRAYSAGWVYNMRLLDEDESWALLRQKVFGNEECPCELEKLGKRIANTICGGLPLAIRVISGLLSLEPKDIDVWVHVANHVKGTFSTDEKWLNKRHGRSSLCFEYLTKPSHLTQKKTKSARRLEILKLNLQQVIAKFDVVVDKMMEIGDEMALNSSFPSGSYTPTLDSENFVVGLDDDLIQLKERLTRSQKALKVLSIVGMGGIGKTTLARCLYSDPLVLKHFDRCAWVTISQEYDVKETLLHIIADLTGEDVNETSEIHVLEDILHKYVFNRRYLIVLDDIWSTNAYDKMQRFFPDNKDGSCIVITTRDLNVANFANSFTHQMHFLNENESWNLLRKKVFGDGNCPSSLEKVGKSIARNCGGLPLAIRVIGGLLSKNTKNEGFWENVVNDVSSAVGEEGERFSKILSLSYEHLPHHLRPCFLYMGALRKDCEIRASRLILLWVAEGFLQPIEGKTLEAAAEVYLKELVDRNLLIIGKKKFNGKAKSYVMHDMLRDLCLGKASQEKFLNIMNEQVQGVPFHNMRRLIAHGHSSLCKSSAYGHSSLCKSIEAMRTPLVRSILYSCHKCVWNIPPFSELPLLRVLDASDVEFSELPGELELPVNVRFVSMSAMDLKSFGNLSQLWSLQTIIISSHKSSPDIKFSMLCEQLRHIKVRGGTSFYMITRTVYKNIQTLSGIRATEVSDLHFTTRFPNLRKLGVNGVNSRELKSSGGSKLGAVDLSHLDELETLAFSAFTSTYPCIPFSTSLKTLSLRQCDNIPCWFINAVGKLPNLQVLKLRYCCDFKKWEPEGEFQSLKFLLLEDLDLVHWEADESNFPMLEHLVIRGCYSLEKIPEGIGEISTMEKIELVGSSPAEPSARVILEKQHYEGNTSLQVLIQRGRFDPDSDHENEDKGGGEGEGEGEKIPCDDKGEGEKEMPT